MPDITIKASDGGSFGGYCAVPKTGSGPGLVVIQEIFGVNTVMRDLCNGFAADGYVAVCPDLFWRQQPGVQLSDKTKEEWDKAFALMNGFDFGKGLGDIAATIGHLRGMKECSGKVGAVGYCMGGSLAYLTACNTDTDASVGYYPVQIENQLHQAENIKKPLMLHIAEQDQFCPPEAQKKIKDGLSTKALVTIHSYGADHAFARIGGEHYDQSCAELANRRTAEFFAKHLS